MVQFPLASEANIHSKCMDQIEKWHQLFTKGIISEEQHKELVDKVWKDKEVLVNVQIISTQCSVVAKTITVANNQNSV